MYRLGSIKNWSGRNVVTNNEYVFQKIKLLNLNYQQITSTNSSSGYVILGFCSDEGIKRNQGRVGAAEGPKYFRSEFAKMPLTNSSLNYYDAGDIICINENLEQAHKELSDKIDKILSLGFKPVVIGGGHDTAWGHFLGIHKYFGKNSDLAILNFDAHFDLREPVNKVATSGTPFYQINEYLKIKKEPFNYYCAGIQNCANTKGLFSYANSQGVRYIPAEEINNNPTDLCFIEQIIKKHEYVYVSICLDVINSSIAPGVSAPQALGIYPNYIVQALKLLKRSGKMVSLDIVELSPIHDINQQTAKLSACLIFESIS